MHTRFDKIKYSVYQTNTTDDSVPIEISGILERHLIPSNLADYQVCVTELNFPSFSIPFMEFGDDNEVGLKITIDYMYLPPPPALSYIRIQSDPIEVIYIARKFGTKRIFQISQIVEMINYTIAYVVLTNLDDKTMALYGIHIPLYTGESLPPVVVKEFQNIPYCAFQNGRIVWYADLTNFGQTIVMPPNIAPITTKSEKGGILNIYLSTGLYLKMKGVDTATTSIPDFGDDVHHRLLFVNYNGLNVITDKNLIYTQQDELAYNTFSELIAIQLTTSLPTQNSYSGTGNINNVLLDFTPDINSDNVGQNINYTPIYPYDWRDILSSAQITDVTFRLYYVIPSSNNKIATYPIILPPNKTAKVTIMFQKKQSSNY